MKNLLFLLVLMPLFALAQGEGFPCHLTFAASVSDDWTTKLQDVHIALSDETGKILFTGSTDENGKLYLDGIGFFPGKDYTVTADTEGFYLYRNTFKFMTIGDYYDRLVIDLPMEPVKLAVDTDNLHFDLTVRVCRMNDRSRLVTEALVTVMQGDSILFRDCTDATGKIYLDTSYIQPDTDYKITVSADGFYEDRNGTRLSTKGLEYDQNFVIDIGLMQRRRCLLMYPCYTPSAEDAEAARYNTAITALQIRDQVLEQEAIRIARLAVYINGDSADTGVLLREAVALRAYLREYLPEFTVDEEIRRQLGDDSIYGASCVGVMWLPEEESQSITR